MPSVIDDERFRKGRFLARVIRTTSFAGVIGDPNIAGIAYGQRVAAGQETSEPALVVFVIRKLPEDALPGSSTLPRRVFVGGDSLEVDVVETGPIFPLSFTTRERPAPHGVSIGHPKITAGTLGALVTDLTDQTLCILSNNHVLADVNNAAIGDAIIQPGAIDGGVVPADIIARLKRFIPIDNAASNLVDAAIAEVLDANDVVDEVMNKITAIATPDHPAVGLLFAGSANRTIMNPIATVLSALTIEFANGPGVIASPDLDLEVEKVGRTTEHMASTVTEIDATVMINYGSVFAPDLRTFDDQIVSGRMSQGGDSGSVVYRVQ